MKIKKNWLQFKEPQAPSTQSASDRSLSSGTLPDDDTNDHNNIEVLPWLNDEELSDNESDNRSTDEESADQMREKFLAEKLK